jgi:ribonuclease H2 subunit B
MFKTCYCPGLSKPPSTFRFRGLSASSLSKLEEYESRIREEEAALLAAQAPKKSKAKAGDTTKRKAANQISRGVDKLKKVNTVGMTKLSSFFQKAAKE